ncbi:hypothetical protein A8990_12551 [Paenibacillus taihuensis]|uniref:Uncharacterized protein n=1 Tax=Paenibacillus taihuensis TaxID=1156355 RepID=A0A3D9RRQ7_9BACL|nr:hypothetical protein [Paenibacillus taihuensis]REE78654.1 hypothetical protein A8990_12551 [Paenibacillus taihuensis]
MLQSFIQGNDEIGYWVEFGRSGPVLTQNGEGELTAVFANPEGTVSEQVDRFRAAKAERKQDGSLVLSGIIPLSKLDASVSITITYTQVNDGLVSKQIDVASDTALTFSLANRLEAKTEPDSFWSFQEPNAEGGPVYEIYPAVGMSLGGTDYGLLTDNGYRNRWTRISRRKDDDGYLVGLDVQPDAELTSIAGKAEREAGRRYVQFKFGEALDFRGSGFSYVNLPGTDAWRASNGASLAIGGEGELRVSGPIDEQSEFDFTLQSGIELPLHLDKNEMYEIEMTYSAAHALTVKLLDADKTSYFEWGYEYGAFRDNIPATAAGETGVFTKRFFGARFKQMSQSLLLKVVHDVNARGELDFVVRELRIRKYEGNARQFHVVRPDEPASLRLFLFGSEGGTHRDRQIASQVKLAEGLGFEGTEHEKIMYADNQMQIWIAQHDDFRAHLVPNMNYHPDMYLRDAFWHASAIDNREVSEQCWQRYAESQKDDGQLYTLIIPYFHPGSPDDNESTLFFLMWAWLNQKKYGTAVNDEVIKRTFGNIIANHSPMRDGRYLSRTAGWLDTIWHADKKVRAINQGHYAVALQCARDLGMDVEEREIELAKDAYRELYDAEKGYVQWSADEGYISPSVLLGEFLNQWLFGEPILSAEAVIGTVERLPVIIRGVPCISDENGQFFTNENKPWEGKFSWRDGVYHNGGSWFLYEYLAYAAAARHGWDKGEDRMRWRVEMEFGRENEPYSHEFIPLSEHEDDWWPSAGVFAWNTFMVVANRVVDGSHAFAHGTGADKDVREETNAINFD